MKVEIGEGGLVFLIVCISVIVGIGIGIAQTPEVSHDWSQIICDNCITSAHIDDALEDQFSQVGAASNCQVVSDSESFTYVSGLLRAHSVNCPSGTVMGGGCKCTHSPTNYPDLQDSYPTGTGWHCGCDKVSSITAYAICCT